MTRTEATARLEQIAARTVEIASLMERAGGADDARLVREDARLVLNRVASLCDDAAENLGVVRCSERELADLEAIAAEVSS